MRKILSLLLIFILTVPFVPVSADSLNQEAIIFPTDAGDGQKLLNCLGIETMYTNYTDEATRGEMLALIMQLLNVGSYQATDLPFIDISISEPLAAYAQAALSLGIISPAETFVPNRPVAMPEAAKMAVVALGYANEAILMGGYPAGYINIAQRLGLFDSMVNPHSDTLTIGDMYILLKNMSETDIRIQSSFGSSSDYTVTEGVNIITYYHKLYMVEGIIEANEYTSLYDPDVKSGKNCITIDTVKYRYTGDIMLGENVTAYVKDSGNIDTIIYAYSNNTDILNVAGQNVGVADGKVYITNDSEKETNIKISNDAAIIYNGQASAKISALNNSHLENSEITFISNDGDKTYDVISIMQSRPFMVSGINVQLSKIYGKYGIGTISMDDTSKDYLIYIDDVKSEISQIKENTIADVYVSENASLITVKINSKTITGEITGYATGEKIIYINDIAYTYTDYFETYYKSNAQIGKEVTLYLTRSGLIAACESIDMSSLKYGYFLQAGIGQGLDSDISVRIFTSNGKYEIFTLADKIKADGISGVTPQEVISNYLTSEQLIRYALNDNKEINKIDTEYSYSNRIGSDITATTGFTPLNAADEDKLTRYKFPGEDTETTVHFKYNAMHPHFSLSETSIIFVVDKSLNINNEKRCAIKTRSSYSNDQKFSSSTIRPYNVAQNGSAEVMLEFSAATGASLSGDNANYGVVQSFNRAVTPDGDNAIKLVLCKSSTDIKTAYLTDETLLDTLYQSDASKVNGDLPISSGDIVRCTTDTNNIITAITVDYDYSLKKVVNRFTGTNVARSDYQGYMYAYNPEDDIIFLSRTNNYASIETAEKLAVFTWGSVCIYDSKKQMVYPATLSDVITYEKDPAACDYVYLRVNWAQGNLAVIYR